MGVDHFLRSEKWSMGINFSDLSNIHWSPFKKQAATSVVILFFLPLPGTWRAAPFLCRLTTTASSPAALTSPSLPTNAPAPSPSPRSFSLTDRTMRKAAMWAQRQESFNMIHLCFLIYSPTVKLLDTYYKAFGLYSITKWKEEKTFFAYHFRTLCSNGLLFFSVRVGGQRGMHLLWFKLRVWFCRTVKCPNIFGFAKDVYI